MARLQNPWPQGYSINPGSPFGWRTHPISGKRAFHHGVDVAGSFPVTAAADGRVLKVGWSPSGGGHTCLIDHGDIVTVYYHGQQRAALSVGQEVKAGDFIFKAGSTGASTGNHLHFEVRRPGGVWGDTMDPQQFLPKPGEVALERPQEAAEGQQEPASRLRPPRRPMSSGLARFFDMQRALKQIPGRFGR